MSQLRWQRGIGWTQADPLYLRLPDKAQMSTPRRANIYAFSLNNALRYVDPDGLDPKLPASGGALSYRSEKEISEAGRAANMADDQWTMQFSTAFGLGPSAEFGCFGLDAQAGGGCGLSNSDPGAGSSSLLEAGLRHYRASQQDDGVGIGATLKGVALVVVVSALGCPVCGTLLAAGMLGGNTEGSALAGAVGGGAACRRGGGGCSAPASRAAPIQNFAPGQLETHFVKHAAEWGAGNITRASYLKRAQNLLGRQVGGEILGATRANGDILRYSVRTNEFAVGAANGTIRTLFRPQDGMAYWLRQVGP